MRELPSRKEAALAIDRAIGDVLGMPAADVEKTVGDDGHGAWDSGQFLLIVLGLEEEFGVRFTPEELERSTSRAGLIALLTGAGRKGGKRR